MKFNDIKDANDVLEYMLLREDSYTTKPDFIRNTFVIKLFLDEVLEIGFIGFVGGSSSIYSKDVFKAIKESNLTELDRMGQIFNHLYENNRLNYDVELDFYYDDEVENILADMEVIIREIHDNVDLYKKLDDYLRININE